MVDVLLIGVTGVSAGFALHSYNKGLFYQESTQGAASQEDYALYQTNLQNYERYQASFSLWSWVGGTSALLTGAHYLLSTRKKKQKLQALE